MYAVRIHGKRFIRIHIFIAEIIIIRIKCICNYVFLLLTVREKRNREQTQN